MEKVANSIFLNAFTVFLLTLNTPLNAQDDCLDQTISIHFQNDSLIGAILKLEDLTDCYFAINVSQDYASNIINKNYQNQPLKKVLDELTGALPIQYKLVNKQIIIYHSPAVAMTDSAGKKPQVLPNESNPAIHTKDTTNQPSKNSKKTLPSQGEKSGSPYPSQNNHNLPDPAVPFSDTIFMRDSMIITQYDTVFIYDTIFQKPQRRFRQSRDFRLAIKSGLSAEIRIGGYNHIPVIRENDPNSGQLDMITQNKSGALGYGFQGKFNFLYKNILLQVGLGLTTYSEKVSHYQETESGYMRTDTLDRYYNSANNGDTNWVYITEDVWVETLTQRINQKFSQYYMLSIPLNIGYHFEGKKLAFEPKIGFTGNFMLLASGNAITGKDSLILEDVNDAEILARQPYYTVSLSATLIYEINPNMMLLFEPVYQEGVNSIFTNDFWYDQRFRSIGVQFGLRFKIN